MKIKLFDYQTHAVNFLLQRKKSALFLDMGLGKTLVTLSYMHLKKDKLGKILIVAPLRVAKYTWPDEIKKWGFKFYYSIVLGNEGKRNKALGQAADIYIINAENVPWLINNHKWDFNTLIIDELSMFKSHSSLRFKALKDVSYEYFIGLTGTPAPNGLYQLWSQIFLIDRGYRLGHNITAFRSKYYTFKPSTWGGDFILRPGIESKITAKIDDICLSMKAVNPPKIIFNKIKVEMDPEEKKLYKQMKNQAYINVNDTDIDAPSAASISNKLKQLANGAIYDEDKAYHVVHTKKLDALEDIILSANGSPILVFYCYKFEALEMCKRFKEAKKLVDGSTITAWNSGDIPLLLAHPASCGHGLNLQDGGHIIVWYGLPWSLELYQQANARLARTGQKNTVIINKILVGSTIDYYVNYCLENKKEAQNTILDAVKALR